ncbi:hypothetical protein QTP88_000703 [Uroleucon formosanum]
MAERFSQIALHVSCVIQPMVLSEILNEYARALNDEPLKKKWRGLRDTFGKELKKVNSKKSGQAAVSETDSRWPYFKNLLFLRGTMSRRDIKSSVPDNSDISDEEVLTQTNDIDTRLLQIEEEKLKCFQKSANDPDAQFLMSLLPFLKDIPKHRKLMVRAKLQQVLMDEQHSITSVGLYDNSSDSSQYSVFQQLPEDDLTRYVTQFNPNNNN